MGLIALLSSGVDFRPSDYCETVHVHRNIIIILISLCTYRLEPNAGDGSLIKTGVWTGRGPRLNGCRWQELWHGATARRQSLTEPFGTSQNISLKRHFPPLHILVVDLNAIVKPADVQWWLQSIPNYAPEYHVAAPFHISNSLAHHLRFGHCKVEKTLADKS